MCCAKNTSIGHQLQGLTHKEWKFSFFTSHLLDLVLRYKCFIFWTLENICKYFGTCWLAVETEGNNLITLACLFICFEKIRFFFFTLLQAQYVWVGRLCFSVQVNMTYTQQPRAWESLHTVLVFQAHKHIPAHTLLQTKLYTHTHTQNDNRLNSLLLRFPFSWKNADTAIAAAKWG